MAGSTLTSDVWTGWLADYRQANPERFEDTEFAAWLENEYVPIAGGWQY